MKHRLYPAVIVKVVDGDSVHLDVDVGFRGAFKDLFRMYGINAEEGRSNPAALFLRELLPIGLRVVVMTYKPDKYGRWLCDVFLPDGRCANDIMLEEGHAVPYFGGKR